MYFLCFHLSLFDAKALKSNFLSIPPDSRSLPYSLKVIINSQYDLGLRIELHDDDTGNLAYVDIWLRQETVS